eukprot:scaffold18718_cov45-Attheya_sp.AAC.3
MEDNGYIDATEFIECQLIYDPEDDSKSAYYAGPMCVDDNEDEDNADGDYSDYQADEANELCQALYEEAAKCEQSHGFDTGYSNYEDYSNQAKQENLVCQYMSALESGTYDESGEIVITLSSIFLQGMSSSRNSGSKTSGGQKFALTFFILGTTGLAIYGAMLRQSFAVAAYAECASGEGMPHKGSNSQNALAEDADEQTDYHSITCVTTLWNSMWHFRQQHSMMFSQKLVSKLNFLENYYYCCCFHPPILPVASALVASAMSYRALDLKASASSKDAFIFARHLVDQYYPHPPATFLGGQD